MVAGFNQRLPRYSQSDISTGIGSRHILMDTFSYIVTIYRSSLQTDVLSEALRSRDQQPIFEPNSRTLMALLTLMCYHSVEIGFFLVNLLSSLLYVSVMICTGLILLIIHSSYLNQ